MAPSSMCWGPIRADGTPIYDIKPYIPFADCHPDATAAGLRDAPWQSSMLASFHQALQDMVPPQSSPAWSKSFAIHTPRRQQARAKPHLPKHAGLDISFTVDETQLTVVAVNDAQ